MAIVSCLAAVLVLANIPRRHTNIDLRPPAPTLDYFSADDGKTFFADDNTLVAPFERNGQEVDAARVFSCGGNRFVGYLERAVSPDAKQFVEHARRRLFAEAAARPGGGPDGDVVNQIMQRLEIKKPGATRWVKELSPQAGTILNVTCPNGWPAAQVGP